MFSAQKSGRGTNGQLTTGPQFNAALSKAGAEATAAHETMQQVADETGGGYFELTKTSDLAPTFTKVASELHSQYVIGFTPTQLDNRVHKLTVKVKPAGMTARARRSYLAAPDKFTISDKS